MKIGSLFSGAGGLDMAVEQVFGGRIVWHSEIDKAASKVLAHRWPDVPNLGSITEIDWAAVQPVDVLCGGFPCQDVSAAGKRAGIKDGTRSGLWSIFADAIEALRPPIVIIENVRGLLSAKAHRDMESDPADMGNGSDRPVLRAAGAVLGDLADLGYDAQWTTVAASSVGAPHRRERVFVLASHANADEGRWGGGRQASWGDLGRHNKVNGRRRSIQTARRSGLAANSPRNGRDEGRPEPARQQRGFDAAVSGDESGVALLPTPGTMDDREKRTTHAGGNLTLQGAVVGVNPVDVERHPRAGRSVAADDGVALLPTPRSSDCFGAGQHGDGGMDLRTTVTLLPTPTAVQGRNETSGRSNPESQHHSGTTLNDVAFSGQWGKYAPAIARWEQIVGPAPPPTEPNSRGKQRLSPPFSEWMMGWPHGWVTDPDIGISRNDQLRIIGNGVCPQQATAALTWLLKVAEVAA